VDGRWWVLPEDVRRRIIGMLADGVLLQQIADEVGVGRTTVQRIRASLGGVIRREMWESVPGRLSVDDRIAIRLGIERGESLRAIACRLGWDPSTISREVARNGGRHGYAPMSGHRRACDAARRPKATKLSCNALLRDEVTAGLEKLWSPRQIAQRLREDHGQDESMQVSHETIYKSLYVQGRGELRRELKRCLRTGRAQRIPRGRVDKRGRIPDMIMISERPAEIEDRAVPGHWEGDLIIGKNNKSAVGTLVERSTRFVMLLELVDQSAETVRTAMQQRILTLPEALRRSITWDQGKEMAQHARFTVETGVPIYFCDPHSPWQRGSNENTNGLLRQYMPKSTDLSIHDQHALDQIADSLNGRPRETLGWRTPAEKLNQALAGATTP
jgi:IS30 family transposase